jgi:chromosome segregation ATPase
MSTLVDSVQRIESGIASGKADELASLTAEKAKLSEALEHARSEAANSEVRFDQLRAAKEEELKLARSKLESANEQLHMIKSTLSQQQSLTSAANAKVEALQEQVNTLSQREERRMLAVRESGGENASIALMDEFEMKVSV